MKYVTSDLYTAAALMIASGVKYDRLTVGHDIRRTIINCEWDDAASLEPALSSCRDKNLTVNVEDFKEAHLRLKREVQDMMKNQQENSYARA